MAAVMRALSEAREGTQSAQEIPALLEFLSRFGAEEENPFSQAVAPTTATGPLSGLSAPGTINRGAQRHLNRSRALE